MLYLLLLYNICISTYVCEQTPQTSVLDHISLFISLPPIASSSFCTHAVTILCTCTQNACLFFILCVSGICLYWDGYQTPVTLRGRPVLPGTLGTTGAEPQALSWSHDSTGISQGIWGSSLSLSLHILTCSVAVGGGGDLWPVSPSECSNNLIGCKVECDITLDTAHKPDQLTGLDKSWA